LEKILALISGRLHSYVRKHGGAAPVTCDVERLNKTDRAFAVAASAAHEWNNDLTVILSSARSTMLELEPGHPARPHVVELQHAAERCAGIAGNLLHYTARRADGAVRAQFATLVAEEPR
jgi:hypothetical protein